MSLRAETAKKELMQYAETQDADSMQAISELYMTQLEAQSQ